MGEVPAPSSSPSKHHQNTITTLSIDIKTQPQWPSMDTRPLHLHMELVHRVSQLIKNHF